VSGEAILLGLAVVVTAYVLGCFTAGWYLVRWRTGNDLRRLGTGSLGGRNTARVVGLRWAALSSAIDLLKGALAVVLTLAMAPGWIGLAMVAVVVGHVRPIQLGGRGGRGLAPAFGALAVAAPMVALAAAATFVALALLARTTLVAVLVAVILAPVLAAWMGLPVGLVAGIAGMAVVVTLGHADPVRALLARRRQPAGDPEAAG
jgi:acyl phosphate:glycerol-3-phosphate acyltransferase